MPTDSTRPHWSYSALSQYLRCPLQYYFERVLRFPRPGPSPAQLLGSVVHATLAVHHRSLMTGTAQDPPKVREDFIARWKASVEEHDQLAEDKLLDIGVGLMEAYLEQPTPERILAVEQAFWVPLTDSSGEVLEKPLLVVPDLVSSSTDQTLTVHEIKTAARAYSEADVASSLQATCYAHALHEIEAVEPQVEFVVLVKTKMPKLQRITTHRDDADFARLGDLARTVERGIMAGVFYPVENAMNCSGCPYFRSCREWMPGHSATVESDIREEAAAC